MNLTNRIKKNFNAPHPYHIDENRCMEVKEALAFVAEAGKNFVKNIEKEQDISRQEHPDHKMGCDCKPCYYTSTRIMVLREAKEIALRWFA